MTSTLDVNTGLRRIVEAGVQLTRADQGFIALADPESDRLYMRAVKNVDEQDIDTLRIPVKDSLVGRAIETNRPVRRTRETEDCLSHGCSRHVARAAHREPDLLEDVKTGPPQPVPPHVGCLTRARLAVLAISV